MEEVGQWRKVAGRICKATFKHTVVKDIARACAAGIIARLHDYTLDWLRRLERHRKVVTLLGLLTPEKAVKLSDGA